MAPVRRFFLLLPALAILAGPGSASALEIYATGYDGNFDPVLFTVDENTGQPTAVGAGDTNYTFFGAIDFHPTTGVLYGVGRRAGDSAWVLITLSTTTGQATTVALLSKSVNKDVSFTSDGTFYGSTQFSLYEINLGTGVATNVTGTDPLIRSGGTSMSTLANDNLLTNQGASFYQSDPIGGTSPLLLTVDGNTYPNFLCTPRFDRMDILGPTVIGQLREGGSPSTTGCSGRPSQGGGLAHLDLATGNVTYIGTNPNETFYGVALAVPEPGSAALVGLGLLGLLSHARRYGRRR